MAVHANDIALNVFGRVVCGVDGSPEGLEAARQAERLRSPEGTLRLAAVAEVNVAVHAGWAMSRVLEELDSQGRTALHRAVDEVHPDSTQLLAGDAAPRLLQEIAETDATLVAVGPHGHSRALGILFGGVTSELLHKASCSVLLARPPRFGGFPTNIILGTDGSEHSLAAAAVAESIAERFQARLERHECVPRPVSTLLEAALRADLLVVGSRGLHGPRALGSVSERVAHRASCSVLVVRP
jgi:nucleotide-binding universal stress UspA family protein